jgi:hypothetical protein
LVAILKFLIYEEIKMNYEAPKVKEVKLPASLANEM